MFVRLALAVLLLASPAQRRERAVFIYPRERTFFRRTFYTAHQRELRARLAGRYQVETVEQVADQEALFAANVDGASLLVLSAHGDPFSMHFASRAVRTIDSADLGRLRSFLSRLDPRATIVLQSCDTGRGFAHLVKEAAGPARTVIAARGRVPVDGMQIVSASPIDVVMHCDDRVPSWDCTIRLR
jgi:hypothetical protein